MTQHNLLHSKKVRKRDRLKIEQVGFRVKINDNEKTHDWQAETADVNVRDKEMHT